MTTNNELQIKSSFIYNMPIGAIFDYLGTPYLKINNFISYNWVQCVNLSNGKVHLFGVGDVGMEIPCPSRVKIEISDISHIKLSKISIGDTFEYKGDNYIRCSFDEVYNYNAINLDNGNFINIPKNTNVTLTSGVINIK